MIRTSRTYPEQGENPELGIKEDGQKIAIQGRQVRVGEGYLANSREKVLQVPRPNAGS